MQYFDVTTNPRRRVAAILKWFLRNISTANQPILMKVDTQMRILILRMVIDKNLKFHKSKMADGRHLENRFSTIRCLRKTVDHFCFCNNFGKGGPIFIFFHSLGLNQKGSAEKV